MSYNSLSAHTSEFTGVSSFNNGKCLRPEVYKEWRNILVTFLAHSSEIRTMPKKERDMVEQMIGAMIFTGLYREIVRNKDEYYELLRVFVKYFGTRIPEDTVVYRSLSCSIGENETNLGAFWTSNLDTAKSYYNGERIFQMKLPKGTRAAYQTKYGWKEFAKTLLIALNEGFFRTSSGTMVFELEQTSDGIPYLYDPSGRRMPVFASHPLWEGMSTRIIADSVLEASLLHNENWNNSDIITIDTFNLLRRTSNCYEYIQNLQNQ